MKLIKPGTAGDSGLVTGAAVTLGSSLLWSQYDQTNDQTNDDTLHCYYSQYVMIVDGY